MRKTYLVGSILLALAVAFTGMGCDDGDPAPDCTTVVNACVTLGAVQCNTGVTGTERCEENADGCAVWTAYEECGGSQICEAGLCRCDNACATAGDTQCNGAVVQTCTADALTCLAWVDTTDCSTGGQICEDATGAAVCADTCTDACNTVNATQCTGNTVETCQLGADGCNDWIVTDTCEATEACVVTAGAAACEVVCVPDCDGKECGDDGCQGTCAPGCDPLTETCDAAGLCQVNCVPDCGTRVCGMDPECGTLSCGDCDTAGGEVCVVADGTCLDCVQDCTGRNCGVDPTCGASCGTCDVDEECSVDGVCEAICTPDCAGKECGDDGCGTPCGTCTAPEVCVVATNQCESCTPDCGTQECGVDPVCGTSCGTCTAPETCGADNMCQTCVPNCGTQECGVDPVCGTSCGTCTAPETCGADNMCTTCVPDCGTQECGVDPVCGTSCGTCTAPETCGLDNMCAAAGDCTELLVDGSFELVTTSATWDATGAAGVPMCDSTCANANLGHSGEWWVWIGGWTDGRADDATVSQSVTIPAGAPATLFFFIWLQSSGATGEFLEVTVDGTAVLTIDVADPAYAAAYALAQVDLTAYADGAAHLVAFHGVVAQNPAGASSGILIDDASLGSGAACCIGECTVGDPAVCQGDSVFSCVADAGGCGVLTLDTDCALSGEVCLNGACVTCVNGCDTEAAVQCNGDVVETCTLGGNGCLDWVAGTDCAATGDFCVSGACVTLTCTDLGSQLGTFQGDNTGLPNVLVPSCTPDESSGEVCYTWTPPAAGTYIFDTEGSVGTSDTILWVLDSTGAEVACDDDAGTGYLSAFLFTPVMGDSYTILVDTWAGYEGAYNLNIAAQICTPAETRCNADTVTLETCNALGSTWVATTCPNGCEEDANGARCTMICADIGSTVAPAVASGTITGLPNTMTGTCGGAGPDTCFTFTAPAGDNYIFDSIGSSYDTVLYVVDFLTGTSLGCNDDASGVLQSSVTVPLTAGQMVNVVMDAYSAAATGTYTLNISLALPESICDDWIDNDSDGLMDCADPSNCQTLPICVPGAGAPGVACTANTDCAANALDPVCFPESRGWPLGYCAEFCDPAADDCPTGSTCFDFTDFGACFHTCATDADCRTDTWTDPNSGTVYTYRCYTEYGNVCGPTWWGK